MFIYLFIYYIIFCLISVNHLQTCTNAEGIEINNTVSEKPCYITQNSVEDLSEKIVRGILATKDTETKPETIDLTGNDIGKEDSEIDFNDSSNSSNVESWVDSIDNLEMQETIKANSLIPSDEKPVNEIYDDEKCNTKNPMGTTICGSTTTQTECMVNDKKKTSIVEEKVTSTELYIQSDFDEKPKDLSTRLSQLYLHDNVNSISVSVTNKNNDNIKRIDHNNILVKAVDAEEFVPTLCIPEDENYYVDVVDVVEEQPFEAISEVHIVLQVLNDVILHLRENPGEFDDVIGHLTDHLVNFVTQEETLKEVVNTIIGQVCLFLLQILKKFEYSFHYILVILVHLRNNYIGCLQSN